MEEQKKVEKAKKRDLKLQALKEKKKGKDRGGHAGWALV